MKRLVRVAVSDFVIWQSSQDVRSRSVLILCIRHIYQTKSEGLREHREVVPEPDMFFPQESASEMGIPCSVVAALHGCYTKVIKRDLESRANCKCS